MYDSSFDYKSLQQEFAAVPDTKKNLVTVTDTVQYRALSASVADQTDRILLGASL
jgi:hypothetical protein